MKRFKCENCGGELKQNGDTYSCSFCHATYRDDSIEKAYNRVYANLTSTVKELITEELVKERMEKIANCRQNLYKARTGVYIDAKQIGKWSDEILKLNPDDVQATFYSIASKERWEELNEFVAGLNAREIDYCIPDFVDYLTNGRFVEECMLRMTDLIERAFQSGSKEYELCQTKIRKSAENERSGIFDEKLQRDVFVAYSSKDKAKAYELVEYLEKNGFSCFIAMRNLAKGVNAERLYNERLKSAIDNCRVFVLVSSKNSRSRACDAFNIEMRYVRECDIKKSSDQNFASSRYELYLEKHRSKCKPRVEYLIEDYANGIYEQEVKKFFGGLTWQKTKDGVVKSVYDIIENGFDDEEDAIERKKAEMQAEMERLKREQKRLEEEQKRFKEEQERAKFEEEKRKFAEEKRQAEEERKRSIEEEKRKFEEEKRKFEEEKRLAKESIEKEVATKAEKTPRKSTAKKKETESEEQPTTVNQTTTSNLSMNAEMEEALAFFREQQAKQKAEEEAKRKAEEEKKKKEQEWQREYAEYEEKKREAGVLVYPNLGFSIIKGKYNGDQSLTSIVTHESVIDIGEFAFVGCKNLKKVVLSDKVEHLYANAFAGCESLAEIVWSKQIRLIGQEVFYKCMSLKKISIPESVKTIAHGAFHYCENLTKIFIPRSVSSIDKFAFSGCTNLTIYTNATFSTKPRGWLFEGVKVVYGVNSLQEVEEKERLEKQRQAEEAERKRKEEEKRLAEEAERKRQEEQKRKEEEKIRLEKERLRKETEKKRKEEEKRLAEERERKRKEEEKRLAEEAERKRKEEEKRLAEEAERKRQEEKRLAEEAERKRQEEEKRQAEEEAKRKQDLQKQGFEIDKGVLKKYSGAGGDVVIPREVRQIGKCAFLKRTTIKSVVVPNTVTMIGVSAFSGCSSLKSIFIPSSVFTIEENAFFSCSNLTIYSPSQGLPRFWNIAGVKNAVWGVASAEEAKKRQAQTEKLEGDGFQIVSEVVKSYRGTDPFIEIPYGVRWIGDNAFKGISTITSVKIPNTVGRISNWAFADCKNLKSVSIESSWVNGFTAIGESAFRNCVSLTNIVIPKVKQIENYAFFGCTGLTSVTLHDSTETIRPYAFSNCSSLSNITLPSSIYRIEQGLFANCTGLKSIEIPHRIRTIESEAFLGCSGLTDLTLGNKILSSNLEEIGAKAFQNCTNLRNITIPKSVKWIREEAFKGCKNLTRVVIPNSVQRIEKDAFKDCPNVTIYAEANKKPDNWVQKLFGEKWNPDKRPVVWGYKGK